MSEMLDILLWVLWRAMTCHGESVITFIFC